MNRYHHHYYGPQIPGILEYHRVYNKFTPTTMLPLTSATTTASSMSGIILEPPTHSNVSDGNGKLWLHGGKNYIFSTNVALPRFELPGTLKTKIQKCLGII
jgi:hypothetical protein